MTSNGSAESMRFLMHQHDKLTASAVLSKLSRKGYKTSIDETDQIKDVFSDTFARRADKWRGGCSVDLLSIVNTIRFTSSVLKMTGNQKPLLTF